MCCRSLNLSDYGTPASVWMAHTPTYKDWCNFINPAGDYAPFSLDGNVLTIRSSNASGTIYGGFLASMSQQTVNGVNTAVGFAQQVRRATILVANAAPLCSRTSRLYSTDTLRRA